MNITEESEYRKKSNEYDEMFYSLLNKINKSLEKEEQAKFDVKSKTLYINGKINANNDSFIALCENYKFFISKSLF